VSFCFYEKVDEVGIFHLNAVAQQTTGKLVFSLGAVLYGVRVSENGSH